jgi:hypothetical protein
VTDLEIGVENCRAKLKTHGLLAFVGREEASPLGTYHFHCTDPDAFRARLKVLDFTPPGRPEGRWESRERVPVASLHIKHFDGWPADKLQAHIDPHGIGGLIRWLRHVCDYNGYRDVRRIRRLLIAAGLDPSAP